jgi:hypothetical protein
MRKLTLRDLLATLIVAAVLVPFIGYSVRGSMPFVQDPRGGGHYPWDYRLTHIGMGGRRRGPAARR